MTGPPRCRGRELFYKIAMSNYLSIPVETDHPRSSPTLHVPLFGNQVNATNPHRNRQRKFTCHSLIVAKYCRVREFFFRGLV